MLHEVRHPIAPSGRSPGTAESGPPPGLAFHDEEFAGLTPYYHDDHFEQSAAWTGPVIVCETLMYARCACQDAIALLRGPWTWWDHGFVSRFRELEDGSNVQVLAPVWWFWTRVQLRVFPPVPLAGLEGVRLPILMTRHFAGVASIDVYRRPEAPGQVVLRGRFHRAQNRVPLVPLHLAEHQHLRAEAGTLIFPFPRDGGWRGLLRRLECVAQAR